jgi:hypothetical protein
MADDPDDTASAAEPSEEFRLAFARELRAFGYTATRWDADGLDCVAPDGQSQSLGLSNLWRRARTQKPEEWTQAIRDFLSVVERSWGEGDLALDSLDEAADRLMVRIGQPYETGAGVSPWRKRLPGTDLAIHLVIDSAKYMKYVTTDLMEQSDRPPGDWLDLALENLRERTPADYLKVLDDESGILWGCQCDSYDASRALILSEIRDPGPAGWLLCIPNRDLIFALPATLDHVPHFHLLKVLAEKNHQREPYPISDEVYWVRGRRWEVFSVELGEQVTITPSEEFVKALGLAVEGENGEPPVG